LGHMEVCMIRYIAGHCGGWDCKPESLGECCLYPIYYLDVHDTFGA
jgi:hypothetical protein